MPIPIQLNTFLSLAISFTIVYFVIPKIIKVSRIKKLFDVPNHRSAAKQVVPRLGGISILAGFTIGLIISSDNYNIDELKHLIAGILVMFVIGLKETFGQKEICDSSCNGILSCNFRKLPNY